jgi:hypothetical protein
MMNVVMSGEGERGDWGQGAVRAFPPLPSARHVPQLLRRADVGELMNKKNKRQSLVSQESHIKDKTSVSSAWAIQAIVYRLLLVCN